jgi:hypothetical protein
MNWTTDRSLWRSFSWIWNFLETERADCRERPHELTRNWAVEEEEEELQLVVVGSGELGESVTVAAADVNRKRFCIKEMRFPVEDIFVAIFITFLLELRSKDEIQRDGQRQRERGWLVD